VEDVHRLSRIDRWFLSRLKIVADIKAECLAVGALSRLTEEALRVLKMAGFSDRQIARYTSSSEMVVRRRRQQLGVLPYTKQIDTLAAEFPAETNYLYMTYNGSESDTSAMQDTKLAAKSGATGGVMVLGCGAYCIGSSVSAAGVTVSAGV
jgi:hypothetical protein